MATIELTRGQFAVIDDEDFERLSAFKWHANKTVTGKYYAARKSKTGEGSRTIVYMHKIINPLKGGVVDHINGDGLDNRKANLRILSQAKNVANRRGSENCGVFFCSITGRWAARVSVDGRRKFLGRFDTKELALRAAISERQIQGIVRTETGTGTAV